MFRDLLNDWAQERLAQIKDDRLKDLDKRIADYLQMSETEEWWKLDDEISAPYPSLIAYAQHWLPHLFDGRLPIAEMPQTNSILQRWQEQ